MREVFYLANKMKIWFLAIASLVGISACTTPHGLLSHEEGKAIGMTYPYWVTDDTKVSNLEGLAFLTCGHSDYSLKNVESYKSRERSGPWFKYKRPEHAEDRNRIFGNLFCNGGAGTVEFKPADRDIHTVASADKETGYVSVADNNISSTGSYTSSTNQSAEQLIQSAIRRYHQVAPMINLDQSKKEVLNVLLPTQEGLGEYGKPREAFKLDGKTVEIYYMRSALISDGATTDDEFVPYSFVDGELVAIGWQSLGGAKTFGDGSVAEKRNAARQQLLLGVMGLQQQQNQFQNEQQNKLRRENQQKMDKLLTPPPKIGVTCRTQYFGSASRTVCD